MIETREFDKGMDLDSAAEKIANGRTRRLLNMRSGISNQLGNGGVETARGNLLVANSLPTGTNKTIGSYLDETENQLYYFNYNSLGQHGIYRWLLDSPTVTTVLVDPLLNFNLGFLITGVNIVYIDNVPNLFWTDGGAPNGEPTIINNPPRQLDINKAIQYTQGNPNGYSIIDVQTLDLIPWQPKFAPTVQIVNDSTYNRNNLTHKLFQFAYQYEYFNFQTSALSDYSQVVVPIGDEIIGNAANVPFYLNNRIDVTLTRGADICTKIKIYARIQNSTNTAWYLVDTIDNPTTPTVVYQFWNDKVLEPFDVNEANKLFDEVPRTAKAQTLTPSNRLLLANVKRQYDLPKADVTLLNQSIDLPQIDNAIAPALTPLTTNTFTWDIGQIIETGNQVFVFTVPNDPALIVQGNLFRFNFVTAPAPAPVEYIYYYIQAEDVADFNVLIANLILFLQNAGLLGVTNTGTFSSITHPASPLLPNQIASNFGASTLQYPYISQNIFDPTEGTAIISAMDKVSTFLAGSTHYFALEYVERAGRYGTVVLNQQFNVYVPYATETLSTTPYIKQNQIISAIRSLPPIWATHYRWKYGGCNITNVVYTAIKNKTVSGAQNTLYLDPITDFSTEYPSSILTYSYTTGDRCRIATNVADVLEPVYIDVPVNGYDEGTLALTVNTINYPNVTIAAGTLIEIYTPRPDFAADQTVYYTLCSEEFEIGDAGLPTRYHKGAQQDQDPTNPTGVPAVSTFSRGNAWLLPRQMNCYTPTPTDKHDYWVESFNYSDFYASQVYDKGRANKYDPNYKEVYEPATIWYTQPYQTGTNINGLGSVFDLNFGADDIKIYQVWKSIQALFCKGDYVHCFQELNTCKIPINNLTVIDSNGGQISGATDKVLNQVQYYNQGYGINTNPEGLIYFAGRFYHPDVIHGVWLRLSTDGYTPISQLRAAGGEIAAINNFTQQKFNEISNLNQRVNIFGSYDVRYDTAVWGVEDTSGREKDFEGFTISFFEGTNMWESFWSYKPDWIARNAQELITFYQGQLYVHDKGGFANYYGVQYDNYVEVVYNTVYNQTKLYENLTVQSNNVIEIPEVTNNNNQLSLISSNLFRNYEGNYYAEFLRDSTTPVANPLNTGDHLRGNYIQVRLQGLSGIYTRLISATVRFISSAINLQR